ncbi:hypothetical protein [Lutibacter sp.]|uniref:hypothetical protein n=1 Tax=Lutibacter sp. TaxID=1925666 RepID=UPI0027369EC4|nr:hypothetical protein [Lutibacter sp.]MDP3313918.1 hypothetical protein [Lutibacter sp.]
MFIIQFIGYSQSIGVTILGSPTTKLAGSTITMTSGNSLTFQVTNTDLSNCENLRITGINLSNTNFSRTLANAVPRNLKSLRSGCGGNKTLNFTVTRTDSFCDSRTVQITIETQQGDFIFNFEVNRSPIISVLGGSPSADITNNSIITTATNGTYFGVVEELASVTRYYTIVNTGSCPLVISSIVDTHADFVLPPYVLLPNFTPTAITTPINPGTYVIF